jgi:hypothetical protein
MNETLLFLILLNVSRANLANCIQYSNLAIDLLVFPALRGRALALMPEKETWAKGALETLREVQSTLGIAKAKLMEVASVI